MLEQLKKRHDGLRPLASFPPDEIASALRTVITYIITSAFDLTQEEIKYTQSRLSDATDELFLGTPSHVPVAVLQELNTHYYSVSLLNRTGGGFSVSPVPQKADLVSWVNIFTDMCLSTYDIDSAGQTRLYIALMGVMTEIGVKDQESRFATYLPNALQEALAQD